MERPLVSICIPTYERLSFFKKLIQNIESQSFRDYEIVVTDNSESDDIKKYIQQSNHSKLRYFRNSPAVSMGENWNRCFEYAEGTWLKMMHDDDYFAHPDALSRFVAATAGKKPGLIFGRLCFNDEDGNRREFDLSPKTLHRIANRPVDLIGTGNRIGNPCNTLIHRDVVCRFNPDLKWIIDFECYIRILSQEAQLYYINETLVEIFYHSGQVTSEVFLNKSIEIPENDYLFDTYFPENLRWFMSFDYFWRKIRNLKIRSENEYVSYLKGKTTVQPAISAIIRFQRVVPPYILRIGVFSKLLSLVCWQWLHLQNSYKTL